MLHHRLRPDWAIFRKAPVVAALLAIVALGVYLALAGGVLAQEDAGTAEAGTTVTHVLPYQGRMLDPGSGQPKPDGDYTMTFRLYTAATGGSAIWTEGKTVTIANGLFHTFLGDATPLDLTHFNGQNLWVGVTVGSEAEATPRLRLGFGAYAFYAESAATAVNAANATNATTAGNATNLGGQPASAYAAANHNHSDLYYTKTEADSRYFVASSTNNLTGSSDTTPILTITQNGLFNSLVATTNATAPGRAGVVGRAGDIGPIMNGVSGVFGSALTSFGVAGTSGNSSGVIGFATSGTGVNGQSSSGVGVRALSSTGTALVVTGNATVSGNLSLSGTKSFKIDHPLDPANMYLYHAAIESPDMMNLYNGIVTLDESGEAWVELPGYFEALNREFRYQLTPIGERGPNLYIAQEVADNRFAIGGGTPGLKVSWQVTGIRHDPYAEANRMIVEVVKPEAERGSYLTPEVYGFGPEYSLDARLFPEEFQNKSGEWTEETDLQ